ncbi:MAG: glycosyltransferase, partial [bacterium]
YAPESIEHLADGAGIRGHLQKSVKNKLLACALVLAEAAAILRHSRDKEYINSHWLVPSGLLVSLLAGKKNHVITAHAADYDLLRKMPAGDRLIRLMAKPARAIVCAGSRLAEGIGKTAPHAKVLTRPMGVDTSCFAFSEEKRKSWRETLEVGDEPVVLFVGKLSAKKGVDVLIRAMSLLHKKGVVPRLVIAGTGALEHELKSLAEREGVLDKTVFLGPVPNEEIAGLYSAADAMAVPSVEDPAGESEGMPVVILEALAAGRPVVASRLCSVPPELKSRGVLEVKDKDASELASCIEEALAGNVKVDLEAVKEFDVREVARLYRDLLLEGES